MIIMEKVLIQDIVEISQDIFTQNDIPIYTGTDSNIEYMKIKEKYKETKSIFTSSTKMIKQYYDILPHIINIITKIQQIILTYDTHNISDLDKHENYNIRHDLQTKEEVLKSKLIKIATPQV